jgi:hypothetical protein
MLQRLGVKWVLKVQVELSAGIAVKHAQWCQSEVCFFGMEKLFEDLRAFVVKALHQEPGCSKLGSKTFFDVASRMQLVGLPFLVAIVSCPVFSSICFCQWIQLGMRTPK